MPIQLESQEYRRLLTSGEGVVAGNFVQMTRVVESKYADIVTAAYFEPVDAAVGRYQPRRIIRTTIDRSQKVKRQKANCSSMRIHGNSLAPMLSK